MLFVMDRSVSTNTDSPMIHRNATMVLLVDVFLVFVVVVVVAIIVITLNTLCLDESTSSKNLTLLAK
jgi:hypothetical protein